MPKEPAEWAVMIAAILVVGGLFGMCVLVVRDTVRKSGRWGVNIKGLAGTQCPECGNPMPAVRVAANLRQTLWGGWTCRRCSCEIDKWGRAIRRKGDDS